MLDTLFGIVILDRAVQLRKALDPILVILFGKETLVNEEQSLNIEDICSTLEVSVILDKSNSFKELHPSNMPDISITLPVSNSDNFKSFKISSRKYLPKTLWTTFVRSSESMQFVLKTNFCF